MKCPTCKRQIPAASNFCNFCGGELSSSDDYRQGVKYFIDGDYQRAAMYLRRAVKRDKNGQARLALGHYYFHTGKRDQALACYQRVESEGHTSPELHYNLGVLYNDGGQIDRCVEEFRRLFALPINIERGTYYLGLLFASVDAFKASAHISYGIALRKHGLVEVALKEFKQALSLQEENIYGCVNLGEAYMLLKQYQQAEQAFRRAIKLARSDDEILNVHNDLGIVYYRRGAVKKAIAQFKAVIKQDPENSHALYNLGRIYYERGMDPETKKDYQEFTRLANGPSILYGLSKSMLDISRDSGDREIKTPVVVESARMKEVESLIARAALADATVLILGENGTGKEVAARTIHSSGPRAEAALVPVYCATITETLLESELFGHERGAFTGAVAQKKGKFEIADGGTVFLDEIGEVPVAVQVKLLRFLQEREFERVGGNQTIKVDVRVIAATNRDLKRAVEEGAFRQDLFYRLNVIPVLLPPLRERREDIPNMVKHFIGKFNSKHNKHFAKADGELIERFFSYRWPGNIRELENLIERAIAIYDGEIIGMQHMPVEFQSTKDTGDKPAAVEDQEELNLAALECRAIERALKAAGNNKLRAAKTLGISRSTLYEKLKQHSITPAKDAKKRRK